jgi:hypothetical protein
MPARKGPGRPTELRERREIVVYVTRRERAAIRDAAAGADVSMSAWMRALALAALYARPERKTRPTPQETLARLKARLAALKTGRTP